MHAHMHIYTHSVYIYIYIHTYMHKHKVYVYLYVYPFLYMYMYLICRPLKKARSLLRRALPVPGAQRLPGPRGQRGRGGRTTVINDMAASGPFCRKAGMVQYSGWYSIE